MAIRESIAQFIAPSSKRDRLAKKILFNGVIVQGKRILDIGARSGSQTEYCASKGAEDVVALEPFLSGSDSVDQDNLSRIATRFDAVTVERMQFQDYESEGKPFDIVIMRNSINHLDEDAASKVHESASAQEIYSKLFDRLYEMTSAEGVVIVRDASNHDFWHDLGLSNPFTTSIQRGTHQPPESGRHSSSKLDSLNLENNGPDSSPSLVIFPVEYSAIDRCRTSRATCSS